MGYFGVKYVVIRYVYFPTVDTPCLGDPYHEVHNNFVSSGYTCHKKKPQKTILSE